MGPRSLRLPPIVTEGKMVPVIPDFIESTLLRENSMVKESETLAPYSLGLEYGLE